jgi:hypothetical protein
MMKWGWFFLAAFLVTAGTCMAEEPAESAERHPPLSEERQPVPPPAEPRKIDKAYYDADSVFSETDLFSDRNNGFYKTYHRNGRLRSEVRYKNGWLIYDKAFNEQGQPVFRSGIVKDYYANGVLSEVGHYRNDQQEGEATYYYYDGKTVVDIWHYLNGRQAGYHIRNDAQGNFVFREDWGYPSYHVEKLEKHIKRLYALGAFLLAVIVFLLIFTRRAPKPRP